MVKILADFHHSELYNSFILTLENRLGYELYRPIGHTWHDLGYYWNWTTDEHIINQFLGTPHILPMLLPSGVGYNVSNHVESSHPEYHHRMVTYENFMDMEFDILLSSIPELFYTFSKLSKIHPSHPKVILQMGNNWMDYPKECKNILNSTTIPIISDIHTLNYYPEFDLTNFNPKTPHENRDIRNFIHFNSNHYRELLLGLEDSDWKVKEYGAGNRNGLVNDIHNYITNSEFIWHCKKGGDGYGFVIHQAYAAGRPVIVNYDIYKSQTAGILMKPSINCIDISNKSISELKVELEVARDQWELMSTNASKTFNNIVNFDIQSEKVKNFMENLI